MCFDFHGGRACMPLLPIVTTLLGSMCQNLPHMGRATEQHAITLLHLSLFESHPPKILSDSCLLYIVHSATEGSMLSPRHPMGLVGLVLVLSYHCSTSAQRFLLNSVIRTFSTLHNHRTSSHWHHGQEQKQKQMQENRQQCWRKQPRQT